MEFIFELLFEIIVEGAVQLSSHKKVPMILRILAFIICLAIFGGLTIILFVGAYSFWQEKNTGAAVAFFVIGLVIFIGFIYMIAKQFKEHNQESEDKALDDETPVGEAKPSSRGQIITACISACILILIGICLFYFTDLFE